MRTKSLVRINEANDKGTQRPPPRVPLYGKKAKRSPVSRDQDSPVIPRVYRDNYARYGYVE